MVANFRRFMWWSVGVLVELVVSPCTSRSSSGDALRAPPPGLVSAWLGGLAALVKPLQSSPAAWKEVMDDEDQACDRSINSKVDAEGVIDAFIEEVALHRHSLWALVFSELPSRSSAWAAAALSAAVPAPLQLCSWALPRWAEADAAAVTLLAANCSLPPSHDCCQQLLQRVTHLTEAEADDVTSRLARSRGPMRSPETWEAWYNVISRSSRVPAPPPSPPEVAPPPQVVTTPPEVAPAVKERKTTNLRQDALTLMGRRDVIREAPRDLCCALDGKLLMDPVRSPYGHLFERSNLVKALAKRPTTFEPLSLNDCVRDAEIRLRAARWVRLAVPQK
eukprot:Skav217059  [mRNA]  locus=scaffold208:237961:243490:+ [translate_table: standard]